MQFSICVVALPLFYRLLIINYFYLSYSNQSTSNNLLHKIFDHSPYLIELNVLFNKDSCSSSSSSSSFFFFLISIFLFTFNRL